MKLLLGLTTTAALLVAALLSGPVAAQPDQPKAKPEALPEFPLTNPKHSADSLHPEKLIYGELAPAGDKKKLVRVGLVAEVCLREGPLEVFLCKKGTKEHESIVRIDLDAELIHVALKALGGEPGTPTQFINPKTEEAEWKAATGSKVNVLVHYKKDGKLHTHAAQEWVWDTKKKAAMNHGWVFAGSQFIKDPTNPAAKPYYGANSGDIFAISNFPYATLELPAQISKDDAQLTYEAKTERIPPLMSKVWIILEVVPEKK